MMSRELQTAQSTSGSCPEPLGLTVWDVRAIQEVVPVSAMGALGSVLRLWRRAHVRFKNHESLRGSLFSPAGYSKEAGLLGAYEALFAEQAGCSSPG